MRAHKRSLRRRLAVAIGFGICLAALGGVSSASAAAPPFTQCPAVGLAPTCGILIVVNADNSVSVLGDPQVGPYDGGDDTLVGVENDSASSIDAITVEGPGSDLAGFDGDGLCTYGLAGCPFGSTGYEGPGTSFVTVPSQPDAAEVDFTPGLAPGTTAYFSLEGALTTAAITARQGHLGGYVALGDSFSAGDGAGAYDPASGGCKRSANAYGSLLSHDRTLGSFTFAACSGAVTADIFDANHEGNPEPAQLSAVTADTRVVTLTMGGNDVGFVEIAKQCLYARISYATVHRAGCRTTQSLRTTVTNRLRALEGTGTATTPRGTPIHSMLSVIQAIHAKAPNAEIYLAGYPRLFGTTFRSSFAGECDIGTIHLGALSGVAKVFNLDAAWMNSVADALDDTASEARDIAALQGIPVTYVDPNPYFEHHRLCDTGTSWLNPIQADFHPSSLSLTFTGPTPVHPSAVGQRSGYEAAFLARIP